MLARMVFLTLVGALCAVVLVGGPLKAEPAQAQVQWGPIVFSSELINGEPAGIVGGHFPSDNDGVFVTFSYQNLPGSTAVTRVVQFNHSDLNYDRPPFDLLDCCSAGSGRMSFRVVKGDGKEGRIPGGGYQVYIYAGDQLVLSGGFEVAGTSGDDNPDDAEEDNDGGDNG